MSEVTAVADDGAPTVGRGPGPSRPPAADGVLAQPVPADVSGPATVQALLRGGPAAGKQVEVPRIADTYPLFIGVDGGNYVRDKGATERPVYNWWPSGASSPAGDPTARADAR